MALGFSNYLEPKLLDHILRSTSFTTPATPFLALHDDQPGEAGSNEVTGGSYARVALVMNAASGNSITNNGNHDFASMPAVTVTHISVWDASSNGNLLMYGPLGGTANTFTGTASGDVCTSYGHGLSNNASWHCVPHRCRAQSGAIAHKCALWDSLRPGRSWLPDDAIRSPPLRRHRR